MLEGILWDNDGVLVDTERLFYQANRLHFAGHDIDLTEQDFFDWFLMENRGAWHLLAQRGVTVEAMKPLRQARDRLYSELLGEAHDLAVAGMADMLGTLAPRLAMGIVTSSRRDHFEQIHARLDMLRHFKVVVTDEMYANSKPAPEPYQLGLKLLGIEAERCLAVEDSPRGLQAARAAGLRCICVRSRLTAGYDFAGAYRVVDSVAQLRQEIDALIT